MELQHTHTKKEGKLKGFLFFIAKGLKLKFIVVAQINQFDPYNQIFLKIWLKPSSSAMKISIKFNIFTSK